MVTLTRAATIGKLQSAIDSYDADTGPGSWEISKDFDNRGRPSIALTYTLDISDCTDDNNPIHVGDEPWTQWGGNAILKSAGLESWDGIAESYRSKYAQGTTDDQYSDSALIEVLSEE